MLFFLYETIIFLISFHFSKLICAPYRVVLIYVVNLLKNEYYWQIQDCTVEGGIDQDGTSQYHTYDVDADYLADEQCTVEDHLDHT